jgi:hypothetical protein
VPINILMVKKKYSILMIGLLLAGTIGGPMAYFRFFDHGKSPAQATAGEPNASLPQGAALAAVSGLDDAGGNVAASIAAPGTPGAPAARPSSVRVQDASRVFDFQVTPEWIVAQWPNVSTGLAQLQLEGYRVPLVTGARRQDLAGSLTYYFNNRQKLQQITFIGSTGDPNPLIGLLAGRFHLARRLTNDPGLVVFEAANTENQLASSLKLRLAQAQAGELYRHYDVEMSLQRPSE